MLKNVLENKIPQCFCPICNNEVEKFEPFGMKSNQSPRPNAKCPVCGSLERHRLVWLYFQKKTNIFTDQVKMLHVSPEPQIGTLLKSLKNVQYISVDLESGRAMLKMDITNISFPDNTFDIIYASHVLEHIPNDQKAMEELQRVCKSNGWAILQVPIYGNKTIEDPTITSPQAREKIFGQYDHVRLYGHDNVYRDRLIKAGWNVHIEPFARQLGKDLINRHGLMENEDIYYCTKYKSSYNSSNIFNKFKKTFYKMIYLLSK
jgi:SAM-dependent methyltransferase